MLCTCLENTVVAVEIGTLTSVGLATPSVVPGPAAEKWPTDQLMPNAGRLHSRLTETDEMYACDSAYVQV